MGRSTALPPRTALAQRLTGFNGYWILAVLFTLYSPVYLTLTAAATAFLSTSYVLPTALGLFAHGRTWTRMGPWDLGR